MSKKNLYEPVRTLEKDRISSLKSNIGQKLFSVRNSGKNVLKKFKPKNHQKVEYPCSAIYTEDNLEPSNISSSRPTTGKHQRSKLLVTCYFK